MKLCFTDVAVVLFIMQDIQNKAEHKLYLREIADTNGYDHNYDTGIVPDVKPPSPPPKPQSQHQSNWTQHKPFHDLQIREDGYISIEVQDNKNANLPSNKTDHDFSDKKQCTCAKVHETEERLYRGKDYIVSGRIVSTPRPWMALIVISYKPSKVMENKIRCGGALLNKRYVLTASHCLCTIPDQEDEYYLPCEEGGKHSGKILYNPKLHLWVLLGINNKAKGILTYDGTEHFHEVDSVISNPKFRQDFMPEDIALIKLERDVTFKKDHIMPICLPSKDDDTDINIANEMNANNRVYSSGWGLLKQTCNTDGSGPMRHMKCKIESPDDIDKCNGTAPPIKKKGLCADFRKAEPKKYPQKKDTLVRIMDRKYKKNEICFAEVIGPKGWCDTFMKEPDYNNWGWCKPTVCNEKMKMSDRLKEVRLMLLPLKDCKYLANWNTNLQNYDLVFEENTELCAGSKREFPEVLTYIKVKNDKGDKYEYVSKIRERTLYLMMKGNLKDKSHNYKLNYYLGGGDTCFGDSGGPLYTWIKGVPTIIGVLSRGGGYGPTDELEDGCGEINYPGMYTRVSKYLKWIYENTHDGLC